MTAITNDLTLGDLLKYEAPNLYSRDLVTVALEARGPFESMNEFLAGPAAAGGEVQTVIWEFPLRTLLAQRQIPSP